MRGAFSALFKIQPGEGGKVLQFALLFLLIQAGTAIGFATSDSLFLTTVGADKLPNVYILVPLVMLVYIPASSWLTTRFGVAKVVSLTLLTLVGGGVSLWLLVGWTAGTSQQETVLYAAKIYTAVAFIATYSQSWNFTYQFFNILDGKRLFAFFTGGSALGAILGGTLNNVLNNFIPVSALYLVWAGLAALAIPVFTWICATRKIIESEEIEEAAGGNAFEQIGRIGKVISRSRYVIIMLGVLFFAQVLTTLNEYQYLDIFSRAYPTEAALADLIGKLQIGVNLFNLVVSTLVFNRLVILFGVRNVALILPVIYTLVFCWLFLNYGLAAGFFGYFAYQGLMISIDYDNTNLLLNGLPAEGQAQARTLLEGLAEPLATAATGIFLLSFATQIDREMISLIGIGLALVYLILVLMLRHQYVGAMVTNLKKGWLDFSRDPGEIVGDLGEEDLARLKEEAWSRDPEMAPMAIEILWINDQGEAADALLDFMSHVGPEHRDKAEPLFARLLRVDDAKLFRRVINWLDEDQAYLDAELIQEISVSGLPKSKYLARLMSSSGPMEQATAGLQLLKSWRFEERARGLEIFERLFGDGREGIAAGIQAIGRTGDERYAHLVGPFLENPDPHIREEALMAVKRLVNRESGRLAPMLLKAIERESGTARLSAIDSLVRIGVPESIPPLLMLAGSFTAAERRRAEAVVEAVGLQGVPVAVSVLRGRHYPFRGRAIAARALGKLAFPQFEEIYLDIIRPELELAYRSLHRYQVFSRHDGENGIGIEVLQRLYLDARLTVVEFVLELLSIAGRLPDFELISASLRSGNPKESGNAIETIEQGLSQDLFQALLPLIDSRTLDERVQYYLENFEPESGNFVEILVDALNSSFPMGSMVAAQALCELDPGGSLARLRERLDQSHSPEFQAMIFSLIGVETDEINLVEKIHHLMHSPLFESFGVMALRNIASRAEEAHFEKGRRIYAAGDPAGELFLVIDGEIRHPERKGGKVGFGEVFGEECLFGGNRRVEVVSEGTHVLRISREAVMNNVEVFPETALLLLRFSKWLGS